jgi:hypothetical protein
MKQRSYLGVSIHKTESNQRLLLRQSTLLVYIDYRDGDKTSSKVTCKLMNQ